MVKPWKQYRDKITTLYIKEARTLQDVQRIMKNQYGFQASIRSYRQRFDQWDLQKYNCKKRQQRKAEEMQKRSNIERGHVYPSPPTSPDDGYALPAMVVKGEGIRYFEPPGWQFDGAPPHLSTDNMLQSHQERQRWPKYGHHQPVPERKYLQRIAPPAGPWYSSEPAPGPFLPPFHQSEFPPEYTQIKT